MENLRARNEAICNSAAIFRNSLWYSNYAINRISSDAANLFLNAYREISATQPVSAERILMAFECYLCITQQNFTVKSFTSKQGSELLLGFMGSIYNDMFFLKEPERRYEYLSTIRACLFEISKSFHRVKSVLSGTEPQLNRASDRLKELAQKFDNKQLDKVEVTIWRAWPVVTRTGQLLNFDLHALVRRFGCAFTHEIFLAIELWAKRTRVPRMDYIPYLISFLGSLPFEFDIADLKDQAACSLLLRKFQLYFMSERKQQSQYKTSVAVWSSCTYFWKNSLSKIGIFSEKAAFPPMERKGPSPTHIKRTKEGFEVSQKLLTDVPLEISDIEAIHLLFSQIHKDIEIVENWALKEAAGLWNRKQTAVSLSASGNPRNVRTHKKYMNQDTLFSDCCANLIINGYSASGHTDFNFPKPLQSLASDMGIPCGEDLLPHMALLVIDHPSLTISSFETLELYDIYGQVIGLEYEGNKTYLNGTKPRKGPRRSPFRIELTDRSKEIVRQIIELTDPLRNFLKNNKNDDWRRLFLGSQRGFGMPIPVNPAGSTSNPGSIDRLKKSFLNVGDLDSSNVEKFVRRFSLPALRASVAIAEYIEDPQIAKLAINLGHSHVSLKLLQRYLPGAILDFFQQRWIRLFQTSFVIEALKDSESIFYATDFADMEQIHQFMSNHALLVRRDSSEKTRPSPEEETQVIIGVNTEILAIMLKLVDEKKRDDVIENSLLAYWSDFSKAVIERIQHKEFYREDLIYYLDKARALVN